MKVIAWVLAVAGIVALAAIGGHWGLVEASDGSGSLASAASSTCSWCHASSEP